MQILVQTLLTRTSSNLLRSRQQALAYLQSRPDRERTEWQDRLERDQQRVTRRQQRVEQMCAKLQAAADKRPTAQAAGDKIPGTKPVPVEQHAHLRQARKALETAIARADATAANPPAGGRVNTTDPTSAIMPAKHGGFDQLHNVQALASQNQFVIAIGTHPSKRATSLSEFLCNVLLELASGHRWGYGPGRTFPGR